MPWYLMDFGGCTRFKVKDCVLRYALDATIYTHNNGPMIDPVYEGNMFEGSGHDDVKFAQSRHPDPVHQQLVRPGQARQQSDRRRTRRLPARSKAARTTT